MAREHDAFWEGARTEKAARLGLSPVEVSTLASIVQAEPSKPDRPPDRGGIPERLRIGMPLQADPPSSSRWGWTAFPGCGQRQTRRFSLQHIHPCGFTARAINMPEPRNIDAVLNAERHDYLYFCARDDFSGYSDFAKSYAEHLRNARRTSVP
ncbi:MAG: endolytic transglycosylase MltG [Flavobacteriales bacterium]